MSAGVKAKSGAVDVRGEDDAVIAEADFHDLGHAIGGAEVDVRLRDARGGVGDVDGVLAHAFAQLLAAGTRTAAFDDRGREVEVLAEGFGDDGGIGQHGRGTGDLDLVARDGRRSPTAAAIASVEAVSFMRDMESSLSM